LHGPQRLFVGWELRLVWVVAGVYSRGRKELVQRSANPDDEGTVVAETAKAAGGRALAPGMVWIPAGTFLMGSDSHYPEEAPAHKVSIDGFWIDRFTVINREFA
jgi:formylglycine-generating enzyme required for sulfatase activity